MIIFFSYHSLISIFSSAILDWSMFYVFVHCVPSFAYASRWMVMGSIDYDVIQVASTHLRAGSQVPLNPPQFSPRVRAQTLQHLQQRNKFIRLDNDTTINNMCFLNRFWSRITKNFTHNHVICTILLFSVYSRSAV